MRMQILTINWENGDETNFPARATPEIMIDTNCNDDIHDKIVDVIRKENKSAIWTSIVATIVAT